MKKIIFTLFVALFFLNVKSQEIHPKLSGIVLNPKNKPISGATIKVVYLPTNAQFNTVSKDGSFLISNLILGGPYSVFISKDSFLSENYTVNHLEIGENLQLHSFLSWDTAYLNKLKLNDKINVSSEPLKPDVEMDSSSAMDSSTFMKDSNNKMAIFSMDTLVISNKNVSVLFKLSSGDYKVTKNNILHLPSLHRKIENFLSLTSYLNSNYSALGLDNRLNNISVDGTSLNNRFGLFSLPGGLTQANIVSLDALQSIDINVSPYNLKHSGFTGASINAITKSGTNKLSGTAFINYKGASLNGSNYSPKDSLGLLYTDYNNIQFGATVGGPIKLNKLFYLVNFEGNLAETPARSYRETSGTQFVYHRLDTLRNFVKDKLNYDAGPYTGYVYKAQSFNFLFKLDWILNAKNNLSFKLNSLNSFYDYPSNYSNGNLSGLSFYNSNFRTFNNHYGFTFQINSSIENDFKNEFILSGYLDNTYRRQFGPDFPTVEILINNNQRYINIGTDPFSINNRNENQTINFQFNDYVYYNKFNHFITLGISGDYTNLSNTYNPNIFGVYTFRNFEAFYNAGNAYINNTAPAYPYGYSYNYSNIQNQSFWSANNSLLNLAAFLQDEFIIDKRLTLLYGLRVDYPIILSQSSANYEFNNLQIQYYNQTGLPQSVKTGINPSSLIQFSPRFSLVYDLTDKKTTFLKGGLGVFSGISPIIFLSTALTGNARFYGSEYQYGFPISTRPFNPNTPPNWNSPNDNLPANYSIFVLDKNYKYPQLFRINLNLEHHFLGIVFNTEIIYSQNISTNVFYNANQIPAVANFNGPDNRPYFGLINKDPSLPVNPNNSNLSNIRTNPNASEVIVLKSSPLGNSFNYRIQFTKPFTNNNQFSWYIAYNYLYARDYTSIQSSYASGWIGFVSKDGNNQLGSGFTDFSNPHRLLGYLTYRQPINKKFNLFFTLYGESLYGGRYNYVYNGDQNGDGVYNNDLIFIPQKASDLNFIPLTTPDGQTYSVQQQIDALEKLIEQDPYLRTHRGQYMERNGGLVPQIFNFDFSFKFVFTQKNSNTLELKWDIFNLANLLYYKWGQRNYLRKQELLNYEGINPAGQPVYTVNPVFNPFSTTQYSYVIEYTTFSKSGKLEDFWQMQLGLRYIF